MGLDKEFEGTRKKEEHPASAIIRSIIHEIENSLQVIKLEASLLLPGDCGNLYLAINRIDRSLRDLRDYVSPDQPVYAEHPIDRILDGLIERLRKDCSAENVKLNVLYLKPIPLLRVDPHRFRKALTRVLRFCQVLVNGDGHVRVRVGYSKRHGRKKVELRIVSSSSAPLALPENADVFEPFLHINNQHVGLGMALARRILRWHQGDIFFRMESPKRANTTILLGRAPEPARH